MTLIEVIGVVAVIAVLVGILVPVAIRWLDRIAREREAASLLALGKAFEAGVMKTRSLPAQAGWSAFIATNAGIDLNSISSNQRSRARVFVFDKGSAWLSANPAYTQSEQGCPAIPDQPRAILLSSIAGNLPFTDLSAGQFDQLWSAPEGTLPAWCGGDPYDIQLHRINLAPMFVRLLVSTYKPGTNGNGFFGFEGRAPVLTAPSGTGFTAFYIRGTQLDLRTTTNLTVPPAHIQVLQEDSSFVFENNVWQPSIVGPVTAPGIGDLTGIVDAFLKAYPNPNSQLYTTNIPRTQQVAVVATMSDFMSNYTYWASNGFTTPLKSSLDLLGKRDAMMNAIQGLYSVNSQWTNQPPPNMTNPPPP